MNYSEDPLNANAQLLLGALVGKYPPSVAESAFQLNGEPTLGPLWVRRNRFAEYVLENFDFPYPLVRSSTIRETDDVFVVPVYLRHPDEGVVHKYRLQIDFPRSCAVGHLTLLEPMAS